MNNCLSEADQGYVSKSTEETIAKIEEYNKKRDKLIGDDTKVVIGSMDIEKWYQSMIAEPSAKEIRSMVEESEIDFKGYDFDAVSKYLGEYLTNEEIINEGMEEIVYMKIETNCIWMKGSIKAQQQKVYYINYWNRYYYFMNHARKLWSL